jgi:pimeloyl-ACP methyl ester carboxylesterase
MYHLRRGPRRGYADGSFGQIHYQDTGVGAPLVLLHQAPMTSHQFDPVFAPLAERGFRAIAIDAPGAGQSDPPEQPPTIEQYAKAVPAVLDHLGINTADVLGHHTGALVATEVSLQAPERVKRLILNGPLPLNDTDRADFIQTVEMHEKTFAPRADGGHLADLFTGRAGYAPTIPLDRINQYVTWMMMGYGPYWYGHNAAFRYDHAPRLAQISHPTLILTNTGDAIFGQAKWAHRLRPDFAFTTLEGGGIDAVDQLTYVWVEAVTAFLKSERNALS